MANVSGGGTTWNLPNYLGELFTASRINTPVTSMIGGLGAVKQTANFEFPVDSTYAHESAAQPAITETASLTAPTAISYVRAQDVNVTQIFQEKVSISYEKMANSGRLDGVATVGQSPVVVSEMDFQIAKALEKIARDFEYTVLNGAYVKAGNAATANKTRGLNAAAATTINASSAKFSKSLLNQILKAMYDAGAMFINPVIVVNAFVKQCISDVYAYAPQDRNIGGYNIKQIETDFGNVGVVLDWAQTAGTLLVADMSVVSSVSQPIPGKGHLFYEPLAKTGAAEEGQIFGKLGVDHGPGFMHGTITSLATS